MSVNGTRLPVWLITLLFEIAWQTSISAFFSESEHCVWPIPLPFEITWQTIRHGRIFLGSEYCGFREETTLSYRDGGKLLSFRRSICLGFFFIARCLKNKYQNQHPWISYSIRNSLVTLRWCLHWNVYASDFVMVNSTLKRLRTEEICRALASRRIWLSAIEILFTFRISFQYKFHFSFLREISMSLHIIILPCSFVPSRSISKTFIAKRTRIFSSWRCKSNYISESTMKSLSKLQAGEKSVKE